MQKDEVFKTDLTPEEVGRAILKQRRPFAANSAPKKKKKRDKATDEKKQSKHSSL
ncbi:MAG: hypothetical protein OXR72_15755 [Gemmatimonadota bacterium]|nr:hypothetical protein [Gemmatimonadota bacterium]